MALNVAGASVCGTWWRHIPHGGDVWYQPPDPPDGRWQRGQVVEAVYLADSAETAWAEWYRFLAEAGLRPNHQLPRDLWRWEVSISEVADLRTPTSLDRAGLMSLRPGRGDWPRCQAVGERIFHDGWRALIAPSASRPENGRILCVFRTEEIVEGIDPVPPPEVHLEPPIPPTGMRT